MVYANRWLREFQADSSSDDPPPAGLAVIHPDDRALVARLMQTCLAGEAAEPGRTVRLVKSDGGVRHVELYGKKIDYCGRPAIQGTLVDVSSRFDAERNLQENAARLGESNHSRQLFGDIISHDLMNPVWIAENYLRLVMEGGVPENLRPFYDGMRGALAKARGILADARTYLKIQDLVAFSGESVDLGRLVDAVAESLRPLGEQKGQEFAVTLAEGAVISASSLVKELVWQLLSNAIKFGPPNSTVEIAVSSGPPVRLEVRDRGPGVPEEARERIFERFAGLEKGPVTGVGLGLAIVRRIAELHGGRVRVEENPGGGSVFIVEFPAGG